MLLRVKEEARRYVSLDSMPVRMLASEDPERFLQRYAPQLLPAIKLRCDAKPFLPSEGPQPNAGLGTELYYGSYAQTYLEQDIDPDGQAVDIAAPSSRPGASARSTFYSITTMHLYQSIDCFATQTYTYPMIPRKLEEHIRASARYYPVVTVTGPRQSGKTTLLRSMWPDKAYASLENPDTLVFASSDPRGFLRQGDKGGLIIDEAQRHPALFNYLQGYADESGPGRYILSGSNNFLLMERITQSLAGRTAITTLLPLAAAELPPDAIGDSWEAMAWTGFFPRVRTTELPADQFSRDYLATYIERDVRLVKNIGDLSAFRRFVKLCAGRAGQLLNMNGLASDAGISVNTAKSWLGLLEAAWLVVILPPWHENFNKRVIKSPKLYWVDTGLLCHALDIASASDLAYHPYRGAIFENLIVAERYKAAANQGKSPELYFWRDSTGREVDIVDNSSGVPALWECKSGMTIGSDYFKQLDYIGDLMRVPTERRLLAYGGSEDQTRSAATVLAWRTALLRP